jgi:hypothetical protein
MKTPNTLFSMDLSRSRYFLAASALVLMTVPLHANVIVPGDTGIIPEAFTISTDPPILDEKTGSFNFGSGTLTGTYDMVVLVDPLGITCAGCLDFAFQVSVDPNSPDFAFSVNLARFFGYTTNVGYVLNSGGAGALDPNAVSRTPFGVGFAFTTGATVISRGKSTDFLVIATNAKTYDTLGFLTIAGGRDSDPTHNINGQVTGLFEPTFVPEPSTTLLLSLGLLGISVFRKRIS